MSYKTLVAYSRSENELARVVTAIRAVMGKLPDIHVIGLYSIPSPIVYADPNGFIDPGMFELHDKQHNELSSKLKAAFQTEMDRLGLPHEYKIARSESGTAAEAVLTSCYGAELLVAAQPDPNDPTMSHESADPIVFNASCPVLLVPYAPITPCEGIDRVVVAYNGKREAARAAFDALPLLKAASHVELIWVDAPVRDEGEPLAGSGIVRALTRHGINVNLSHIPSNSRHAQDVLRDYVIAERADLLVLGAYSHSRIRELVFGGVTRSMLNNLPVLTLFSR